MLQESATLLVRLERREDSHRHLALHSPHLVYSIFLRDLSPMALDQLRRMLGRMEPIRLHQLDVYHFYLCLVGHFCDGCPWHRHMLLPVHLRRNNELLGAAEVHAAAIASRETGRHF